MDKLYLVEGYPPVAQALDTEQGAMIENFGKKGFTDTYALSVVMQVRKVSTFTIIVTECSITTSLEFDYTWTTQMVALDRYKQPCVPYIHYLVPVVTILASVPTPHPWPFKRKKRTRWIKTLRMQRRCSIFMMYQEGRKDRKGHHQWWWGYWAKLAALGNG